MAAVLLVHRTDGTGITRLPLIGFSCRLVLGTVVDDDDLDIGSEIAPLQNGGDAMVHVLGGVIRGNTECYDFMHGRR